MSLKDELKPNSDPTRSIGFEHVEPESNHTIQLAPSVKEHVVNVVKVSSNKEKYNPE